MFGRIKFSDRLVAGIAHVSGDCASEMELAPDEDVPLSVILAETAIDAGRLMFWGYEDAQSEVEELIKRHGYDAVLREAARHVRY